ncbi:hypothetical protein BO82DRAFT_352307 [Aspergillus uvarum CBS 121591]|uniref:Secreted protein n=1 Tax=Aspergillus uvarum CBS 121591 TaxID=1448315 RepID=A0A319D7H5_9EURO|nr:hypothetical protein BO82DRAFT_352307 [Aspergillus uvarum CBS 121591]PYH83918.1 hypothetical protein BO82DRAFT_352307 [Aspergillus uvarum CBS 121591]
MVEGKAKLGMHLLLCFHSLAANECWETSKRQQNCFSWFDGEQEGRNRTVCPPSELQSDEKREDSAEEEVLLIEIDVG